MIDAVLHVLVLLTVPPLLQGVIVKTKARFAGRVGAPLLQPYFDLAKLVRKEMVISRTTSWVFLAGPAVTLTATVSAALLLPFGGMTAPVHFAGDGIDRFPVTARGGRETRFDDIDTQLSQRPRHPQFFRLRHAATRRLLAIAQGGVEYQYSICFSRHVGLAYDS